jgi:hypothetical protein
VYSLYIVINGIKGVISQDFPRLGREEARVVFYSRRTLKLYLLLV